MKISKELLDYAKENGLKFDIHHRKEKGYKEDFDGFSYTDRGFGYVISADMMQQLYQDRQAYAQKYADVIIDATQAITITHADTPIGIENVKNNWQALRTEQRRLNNEKGGKL